MNLIYRKTFTDSTIPNFINFSEADSIFAFYNRGYTSQTIKVWHVILVFATCEAVIILSGSILFACLHIFFNAKTSLMLATILLVGDTFLGWNVLGISNIDISHFRWYPQINILIEKALIVIFIEMIVGFIFIRKKDILYGNTEIL